LRIDDIGASSKKYEIYSKYPGGNILFLKYLRWFRAWGPYQELTASEWEKVFGLLEKFDAKLTVAITATWVEQDGVFVPYYEKFPDQAVVLKKGLEQGLLEIANHGLTHCVVGKHLPRWFSSNRKFHREFWDWLDEDIHFQHIELSQKILQDYFQVPVTTFVPPGNVYAQATVLAAERFGINLINCLAENGIREGVRILSDEHVFAFHDRLLVLEGFNWLEKILAQQMDATYCFVRDL